MARLTIGIDASALSVGKRVSLSLKPSATAADVIRAVLKECRVSALPGQYALWVSGNQTATKPLQGSNVIMSLFDERSDLESYTFQLRVRSSGVIRVYHKLTGEYQSFESLLLTPAMTVKDVTLIILNRLLIHDNYSNFILTDKTNNEPLSPSECPLLRSSDTFELISVTESLHVKGDNPTGEFQRTLTSLHHIKKLTSSTINPKSPSYVASKAPQFSTPVDTTSHAYSSSTLPSQTKSKYSSLSSLNTASLSPIRRYDSLQSVSPQYSLTLPKSSLTPHHAEESSKREIHLQSLVADQKRKLELQQDHLNSLFEEKHNFQRKIQTQEDTIRSLLSWESKAHAAQERLKELQLTNSYLEESLRSSRADTIEREATISLLEKSLNKASGKNVSILDNELQIKRVKIMELEEKLHENQRVMKEDGKKLSQNATLLSSQASHISELKESIASLQIINNQQKDQIVSLHSAINDKETALNSVKDHFKKEKEQVRQLKAKIDLMQAPSSTLHDHLQAKTALAVEVPQDETLGFTFSKTTAPISAKFDSIVLTSVSAPLAHLLTPGDEILEVNGYSCTHGYYQSKALELLKEGSSALKLVLSRESPLVQDAILKSSSPVSPLMLSDDDTIMMEETDCSSEKLKEADATINQLKSEIEQLLEEKCNLEKKQTELLEKRSESEKEIVKQRAGWEAKLKKKQAIIDSSQEREKELLSVITETRVKLMSSKQTIVALEDKISHIGLESSERKHLQEMIEEGNAKMEKLREELSLAQKNSDAQVETLKQRLDEAERENRKISLQMKQERESKAVEMDTLLKQVMDLKEADMQIKIQETKDLLKQIQQLESEKSVLNAKCGQLTAETENNTTLLQSLTSQNRSLEQSVQELKKGDQSLKEQLASIKNTLVVSTDEKNKTLLELEQARSTNISLEKKKAILESTLEKTESELSEAKETLTALSAQKDCLEEELDRLQAHAREQLDTADKNVQEVYHLQTELTLQREKLMNSETEKAHLQQRVEILEKQGDKLQSQFETLQNSTSALNESATLLQNAKVEIENKLRAKQDECDTLVQQLQDQREEYGKTKSELNSELIETKKDKETLEKLVHEKDKEYQQRQNDLCGQTKELKSSLEQKSEKCADLERLTNELREKSKLLQAKLESVESVLEKNSHVLQSTESRAEDYDRQLTDAKSQIAELQRNLVSKESDISETKVSLEESKSSLLEAYKEKDKLTEKMLHLEKELQTQRSLNTAREEQLLQMASNVNKLTEELQTASRELEAHKTAGEGTKNALLKAQTELQDITTEKEALLQEVTDHKGQAHDLANEKESVREEAVLLRRSNKDLKEANSNLSVSVQKLSSLLGLAEGKVEELNSQLQVLQINLGVAEKSLRKSELDHKSKLDSIQQELNDVLSRLTNTLVTNKQLEHKLESLQKEHSTLKLMKEQLQSECEELQQSQVSAETMSTTIKDQHRELQKAYSELTTTNQQLIASESTLKTSNAFLEDKNRSLEDSISRLETRIEEMTTKDQQSHEQISRLERSYSESISTVEQLQAGQEALKASLGSLGDEKDQEILRLSEQESSSRAQISSLTTSMKELQDKREELESQVQSCKSGLDASENTCALLQAESVAMKEEISNLQATTSQMELLKEKLTFLESSLASKNTSLRELEEQLSIKAEQLQELNEDKKVLTNQVLELANVKVSLAERFAEAETLKQELSSVKKDLDKTEADRGKLSKKCSELELSISEKSKRVEHLQEKLKDHDALVAENENAQKYIGNLVAVVMDKSPELLENVNM